MSKLLKLYVWLTLCPRGYRLVGSRCTQACIHRVRPNYPIFRTYRDSCSRTYSKTPGCSSLASNYSSKDSHYLMDRSKWLLHSLNKYPSCRLSLTLLKKALTTTGAKPHLRVKSLRFHSSSFNRYRVKRGQDRSRLNSRNVWPWAR